MDVASASVADAEIEGGGGGACLYHEVSPASGPSSCRKCESGVVWCRWLCEWLPAPAIHVVTSGGNHRGTSKYLHMRHARVPAAFPSLARHETSREASCRVPGHAGRRDSLGRRIGVPRVVASDEGRGNGEVVASRIRGPIVVRGKMPRVVEVELSVCGVGMWPWRGRGAIRGAGVSLVRLCSFPSVVLGLRYFQLGCCRCHRLPDGFPRRSSQWPSHPCEDPRVIPWFRPRGPPLPVQHMRRAGANAGNRQR